MIQWWRDRKRRAELRRRRQDVVVQASKDVRAVVLQEVKRLDEAAANLRALVEEVPTKGKS